MSSVGLFRISMVFIVYYKLFVVFIEEEMGVGGPTANKIKANNQPPAKVAVQVAYNVIYQVALFSNRKQTILNNNVRLSNPGIFLRFGKTKFTI